MTCSPPRSHFLLLRSLAEISLRNPWDRRYGDRYPRLVAVHNVSIHDALTRYDVLVVGIIGIDRPFVRAAIELPSSDPEVKLIGLREPLSFSFRVRPGSEYSCRRGAVSTLDDESGVSYRSFGHDILL